MTRQPAEEKRITVAWPMPRLAPVRSSVRRGVLAEEGMEIFQARGIRDKAASWTMADRDQRGGIRYGRAGGTGGRARTRTARARCASRSIPAAAALRRSCMLRT